MAMRRCLIMLVGAAMVLPGTRGILGVAAADKKKPVGVKYEVSTRMEGGDEVALTKVWIEGDKQRVEEDGQIKVKVGDTVTTWPEKGKEAMRFRGVSAYFELSGLALPMLSKTFKDRAKKVGEETIAGRACDVYFWTTRMPPPPPGGKPSPEPENKLWLSKNHGIPMKIVRSNLGPNSKDFVSTARKIEVEVNIPDSMFEPPKGMKIVDRTPKPRPKPR